MKNNFQALLQNFFLERLMTQKQVSPCTVSSYRDTFRILLRYIRDEKKTPSHSVTFEMLDATMIIDFMNYLKSARHNSNKTINNRLAAIHSFFDYVSYERPEYLSIIQKVQSIPFKNIEKKTVDYLTEKEMEFLINSCDIANFSDRRDRVMIVLLYNTGMRISELICIKQKDVILSENHTGAVRLLGKGRKERTVPLWKTTQSYLLEYLKENPGNEDHFIFSSPKGEHMTRSGARYRVDLIVKKAAEVCPSLLRKKVTPHVFRHTTAMHLLQAGVDLSTIAIWLGHENMDTTHKYMEADLRLKEQALSKISEPTVKEFGYKPSDDMLTFLDSL